MPELSVNRKSVGALFSEMHNKITRPFDYTEWQRNLFEDMSLEELGQKAMNYWINEREEKK